MRFAWPLLLLIHCLVVSGPPTTMASTPTPVPTSTTTPWASRPSKAKDIQDTSGTSATWQNALQNVMARIGSGRASASGRGNDSNVAQFVSHMLSELPGVMQGLRGVDLSRGDAGRVLASLFADPRAAGTPAWIEYLTNASDPDPANDTKNTLDNLLDLVFTDVISGLMSLNLTANSTTAGDVIAAIVSDFGLLSSLSTEAMHMLAAMAGVPKQVPDLLREAFPVDPASQCATDLQTWASALLHGELWAIQSIDAMGKLQAGVLTGEVTLVGDYVECTTTFHSTGSNLESHMCAMTFAAPDAVAPFLFHRPLTMHLCLPNSCNEDHIYGLLQPTLQALGSKHRGTRCVGPRDPTEDGAFTGVVILLAVLAVLCVAGTIYGIVLDYRNDKQGKEDKAKAALVELKGVTNSTYSDEAPLKKNAPLGEPGKGAAGVPVEGLTKNYMKHCEDDDDNTVNLTDAEGGTVKTSTIGGPEVVVSDKPSGGKPSGTSGRSAAQPGVCSQVLLGFSVLRNGKKILSCQKTNTDIGCLHGIRVLSICWVVLGHAFIMLDGITGNAITKNLLAENASFMVIPAGVMAVDTFFLLSGCLTAFLFLRSTKKSGLTCSGMGLYYFHRVWRLTPLYGVIVGIYVGIFPYIKEGPFQYTTGFDSETTCRDYWYLNLLYVNNIVGGMTKMCFGWSWYLANDMQFSFLAPLVVIPWTFTGRRKRLQIIGFVLCAGLLLTHCISTGIISYNENTSIFSTNNQVYMEKIYFVPWTRVGPYALGLFLGYLMFITPPNFTMSKVAVFCGWFVAAAGALTIVYVRYDNIGHVLTGLAWDRSETAAFEALDKVTWAACVGWVIFACCKGYGGFVNRLLSWSAWMPLSRLTYGVYLVHCIVFYVIGGNLKRPLYVDSWTGMTLFLATAVISFLVSFVLAMLVEAPTLGLEKAVLGKFMRSKK